jgi:DNA-binding beta-propeller fold protein YncE
MTRSFHAVVAAALVAAATLSAQSVPAINYDADADFLALPAGLHLGEVAGVATNSRGHLFVFTRTGHAVATLGDERTFYHGGSRLFEFDQAGKFVKEIGQGAYGINFAQQVRVDPQDNVWVVDAGSNQIIKFDSDGRVRLLLGRKPENINVRPGPGVPASGGIPAPVAEAGRAGGGGRGGGTPGAGINGDAFNRPADVAWDRAGNIYVADGFGTNNRIAKFTKDGNFVKTWGHTGSGPGEFNRIRGLVTDTADNFYVADSGNNRIQVLDASMAFKTEIKNIGSPQAICMTGGQTQYLFSSNSNDAESMDNGEIYKIGLNGQVAGRFGKAGKTLREFGMVNAIDCRTATSLVVGEVWNWRAQKITLK